MSIELEVVLNNSESCEGIRSCVEQAVTALKAIDSYKEQIKVIAATVKEDYEISTKDFNAIVKHSYNDSIDEELEYLGLIEFAVKRIKDVGDNEGNDD